MSISQIHNLDHLNKEVFKYEVYVTRTESGEINELITKLEETGIVVRYYLDSHGTKQMLSHGYGRDALYAFRGTFFLKNKEDQILTRILVGDYD